MKTVNDLLLLFFKGVQHDPNLCLEKKTRRKDIRMLSVVKLMGLWEEEV